MGNFKIGVKVRIARMNDNTGIIVDKPSISEVEMLPSSKPENISILHFWKVKIDKTNNIEIIPEDQLEIIE